MSKRLMVFETCCQFTLCEIPVNVKDPVKNPVNVKDPVKNEVACLLASCGLRSHDVILLLPNLHL
jgi:hypothetical protein